MTCMGRVRVSRSLNIDQIYRRSVLWILMKNLKISKEDKSNIEQNLFFTTL